MTFLNNQAANIPTHLLSINKMPINQVNSTRFLGIILQDNLKWDNHVQLTLQKIRSKVGIFKKLSQIVPTKLLILLYNCIINSIVSYGLEFWGSTTILNTRKVLALQKRVLRIIYRQPRLSPSAPLFTQAAILDVRKLYHLKLAAHAHTLFLSQSQSNAPTTNSSSDVISTRAAPYSFKLNKYTNTHANKLLSTKSKIFWNNSIPKELRLLDTATCFRQAVKAWLLAPTDPV